jgi:hypothetical protein
MFFPAFIPLFCGFLVFSSVVSAQQSIKEPPIDSMQESHVFSFKTVGITDTLKSIVRVQVKDPGYPGVPIQGATVLLRRDKDKMLGRVTKSDGRCNFMPTPATYVLRVQLTGYKSLEKTGLVFEPGKVYELDLRLARN